MISELLSVLIAHRNIFLSMTRNFEISFKATIAIKIKLESLTWKSQTKPEDETDLALSRSLALSLKVSKSLHAFIKAFFSHDISIEFCEFFFVCSTIARSNFPPSVELHSDIHHQRFSFALPFRCRFIAQEKCFFLYQTLAIFLSKQ